MNETLKQPESIDAAMLNALRTSFASVGIDPIDPSATQFAIDAFTWAVVDETLMDLTFRSDLDGVLTRESPNGAESVVFTFESEEFALDLTRSATTIDGVITALVNAPGHDGESDIAAPPGGWQISVETPPVSGPTSTANSAATAAATRAETKGTANVEEPVAVDVLGRFAAVVPGVFRLRVRGASTLAVTPWITG